jgi:hypothetical protein
MRLGNIKEQILGQSYGSSGDQCRGKMVAGATEEKGVGPGFP